MLGQTLLRIGAISEEDLLETQAKHLEVEILEAEGLPTGILDYMRAIKTLDISPQWLRSRNMAVWQYAETNVIHVIAQNILDGELRERLERVEAQGQHGIKYYLVTNYTLEAAISRILSSESNHDEAFDEDSVKLREMAEQAPVIDFVNRVFSIALKDNARIIFQGN